MIKQAAAQSVVAQPGNGSIITILPLNENPRWIGEWTSISSTNSLRRRLLHVVPLCTRKARGGGSMVSLKLQKRLSASVLKCGRGKVWLDPNEVSEISMANSRKDHNSFSLRFNLHLELDQYERKSPSSDLASTVLLNSKCQMHAEIFILVL
ncbi:hypothetical protein ZIOFF_034354 [Zingiber officinale]|uniref:Ribosomal protein L19 n=1 Tax=Zingiber officinale TaxID=94328 RepID=A0A8J5LCU3_ZINOF|nr:hypothetical protein ZIOFF_034354 [Zingiber officinale]